MLKTTPFKTADYLHMPEDWAVYQDETTKAIADEQAAFERQANDQV